jgi:pimeloyl-ACP methyl ester carboxylesterase
MIPFSKKQLKTLKMPVLVLVGDQDLMNNEKTVEVANELRRGKGEIIPNAGHFLSVDQAEVVNRKMVEFLK